MRLIHLTAGLVLGLLLGGCGGGGGGGGGNGLAVCSVTSQKQAVLDIMSEWYFFNDEPEQQQKYLGLDINGFPTAESLLRFLRYRPDQFDRNFSFLTTVATDQQFFGEGQFVGFGFGTKFVDAPANTDLRFTQVFAKSPAAAAGLARGFQLLAVEGRSIAEINAAEGLSAAFGPIEAGVTRTLRVRDRNGVEFDATLSKALVTIDPVPVTAVFDIDGAQVGYVDLRTFISTAEPRLDQVFAGFEAQGVTAVIVDLRYNGGGLVATAERLADLLGGFVAEGQVLSQTLFNTAKSAQNSIELFERRPGSLTLLQQVAFITTGSSASASELIINALMPHTVVTLVGGPTFGKPVGQSAFGYCEGQLLARPVTFEVVNALGAGGFFDGLPVDCGAEDDLDTSLGDPGEASLATALEFIDLGACPPIAAQAKPMGVGYAYQDVPLPAGAPAAQRLLGAF